ncbi:hypothetical protein ATHL_00466 [Anaerolinea thermolimosa]|uniref:hypothetical protein n=1 Tax=Anaerolinea thermolimosa TaxID=229919 RepID=UPI000782714E|nr:hypothetical protein [Anaerolinea thermolimosa]GAP05625.1 hypothetical protein ATHL_00466 [Anaerolinea thermolimosa]
MPSAPLTGPRFNLRARRQQQNARLLSIAGGVLLVIGLSGLLRYASVLAAAIDVQPAPPVQVPAPDGLTSTPFRPLPPTATRLPTATPTFTPSPLPPQPILPPSLVEHPQKIVLRIGPVPSLNDDQPVRIAFLPGAECPFGNQRACLSLHRNGTLSLLTIHSGIGGQGEAFRRAVEGTGLDSAGYSLSRIQANLDRLQNVPVSLSLGENLSKNLILLGVARIPPGEVESYFSRPVDEALELVTRYNPALQPALDSREALLAFEICGWLVEGEGWSPGVSSTTGSIYFGLLREP